MNRIIQFNNHSNHFLLVWLNDLQEAINDGKEIPGDIFEEILRQFRIRGITMKQQIKWTAWKDGEKIQ